MDLHGKYISPCEATWPTIERLHFHLPRQHIVLYQDHDDIDDVLSKPSISDSNFISWMNSNQSFPEGRTLTYAEFVCKFVYNQKKKIGNLEKKIHYWEATMGSTNYRRIILFKDDGYCLQRPNLI